MATCIIPSCESETCTTRRKDTHISFHKVPKNAKLQREWKKFLYKVTKTFNPRKSYVCSEHFTQDDFEAVHKRWSYQRRLLKPGAIPSILKEDAPTTVPSVRVTETEYKNLIASAIEDHKKRLLKVCTVNLNGTFLPSTTNCDGRSSIKKDATPTPPKISKINNKSAICNKLDKKNMIESILQAMTLKDESSGDCNSTCNAYNETSTEPQNKIINLTESTMECSFTSSDDENILEKTKNKILRDQPKTQLEGKRKRPTRAASRMSKKAKFESESDGSISPKEKEYNALMASAIEDHIQRLLRVCTVNLNGLFMKSAAVCNGISDNYSRVKSKEINSFNTMYKRCLSSDEEEDAKAYHNAAKTNIRINNTMESTDDSSDSCSSDDDSSGYCYSTSSTDGEHSIEHPNMSRRSVNKSNESSSDSSDMSSYDEDIVPEHQNTAENKLKFSKHIINPNEMSSDDGEHASVHQHHADNKFDESSSDSYSSFNDEEDSTESHDNILQLDTNEADKIADAEKSPEKPSMGVNTINWNETKCNDDESHTNTTTNFKSNLGECMEDYNSESSIDDEDVIEKANNDAEEGSDHVRSQEQITNLDEGTANFNNISNISKSNVVESLGDCNSKSSVDEEDTTEHPSNDEEDASEHQETLEQITEIDTSIAACNNVLSVDERKLIEQPTLLNTEDSDDMTSEDEDHSTEVQNTNDNKHEIDCKLAVCSEDEENSTGNQITYENKSNGVNLYETAINSTAMTNLVEDEEHSTQQQNFAENELEASANMSSEEEDDEDEDEENEENELNVPACFGGCTVGTNTAILQVNENNSLKLTTHMDESTAYSNQMCIEENEENSTEPQYSNENELKNTTKLHEAAADEMFSVDEESSIKNQDTCEGSLKINIKLDESTVDSNGTSIEDEPSSSLQHQNMDENKVKTTTKFYESTIVSNCTPIEGGEHSTDHPNVRENNLKIIIKLKECVVNSNEISSEDEENSIEHQETGEEMVTPDDTMASYNIMSCVSEGNSTEQQNSRDNTLEINKLYDKLKSFMSENSQLRSKLDDSDKHFQEYSAQKERQIIFLQNTIEKDKKTIADLGVSQKASKEYDVRKMLMKFFTKTQIDVIFATKKLNWTSQDICSALTLCNFNMQAYHYMKNELNYPLPSHKSLELWCNKIVKRRGVLNEVISLMEIAGRTLCEHEKVCVLHFEEMWIEETIEIDLQNDEIVGPNKNIHAIVARGLFSNFTQAVYIDFDTKVLEVILVELFVKLYDIGYNVVAFVSNCSGSFQGLWKSLSLEYDRLGKTYMKHPTTDENIYVFPDAVHLLKLIRDWLLDYGFVTPTHHIITRKFLDALVEKTKYVSKLHGKCNISSKHVDCEGSERLKLSVAAELLNKTTAECLKMEFEGNEEVRRLADFITLVSNWFDIFDSNDYGTNLDEQNKALDEMFEYIYKTRPLLIGRSAPSDRTVEPNWSIQVFQKGILFSIISLKNLLNDMKAKYNINYLQTYKLNQKCFEHDWEQRRQDAKYRPTSLQALNRFRGFVLKKRRRKYPRYQKIVEENLISNIFKQTQIKISDTVAAVCKRDIPKVDEDHGLDHVLNWINKKFKNSHPYLVYDGNEEDINQPSPAWVSTAKNMESFFLEYHINNTHPKQSNVGFRFRKGVLRRTLCKFREKFPAVDAKILKEFILQRILVRLNQMKRNITIDEFSSFPPLSVVKLKLINKMKSSNKRPYYRSSLRKHLTFLRNKCTKL